MKPLIFVFLGGGLGSALRYALSLYFASSTPVFPKATFTANLLGAFLIGLLVGYSLKHTIHHSFYLLLVTGFCGGFTTFSTLSLETYQLWKAEQWTTLGLYLSGSLILGVLLTSAGIYLAQKI